MKVREIMNCNVKTANPNTHVARIIELLQRYRLNSIIVVNEEDKLEGIVTHSDIMGKLLPSQQELMENQNYMTDPDSLEDRIMDILNVPIKAIMTTAV